MKKTILLFAGLFIFASQACLAQRYEFEESQSRVIEPMQDVYIRPMVAEMKMLKTTRQTYGPFLLYKTVDVGKLTRYDLENARAQAAYNAAKIDNADLIVGAMFNIKTPQKGGGIEVTVTGFPVIYDNWHLLGEGGQSDYDWVRTLFQGTVSRGNYSTVSEDMSGAVSR